MTTINSKPIHSVWTLTVDTVVTKHGADRVAQVRLSGDIVNKITADVESRSSNCIRNIEPMLNIEALRTLYV